MSAPDDYSRQFMEGGEAIVSSRRRMPGWFFAFIGVVLAISAASGIAAFAASGHVLALMPLFFTVPLVAAVALMFSHLRATLTRTHVLIQYGLFGPTIPLDRIDAVSVETYDMVRYRGYGLKRAADGTAAFSVPGGDGRCVRIEYRDEHGAAKKLVVTVEDANEFAQAIERARRGDVRVAVESAAMPANGEEIAVASETNVAGSRNDAN